MKLEINKRYILLIDVGSKPLTYHCTITAIEGDFISFIDKFNVEKCYNMKNIISFEEEHGK